MAYEFKELYIEHLDRLIDKYISHYNFEGDKWTYDLAKKRLEQVFLTPDFYGICAYRKSELLGFAIGCFKEFDDIKLYYLEEILVFRDYQNTGLGSKMLEEIELLVKAQGVDKISLSTTHEKKHQRFYSRLGYQKSDFLIPMYKEI